MADYSLAAQIKPFDAATPLANAARIRGAEQETAANQFKQNQIELGATARNLQTYVGSPEFPQKWAEAADKLRERGILDDRSHAQWRNTPSPLMLKALINQTQAMGAETDAVKNVRAAGLDPASEQGRAALFPSMGGKTDVGDIYDPATGLPQKAIINERTGAYKPVGGVKQTQLEPIDREQAKKDVARVELYKTDADSARTTLADVGQLRELRKGVGYEGGLFAQQRAKIGGVFGSGAGQALNSKATEIQLGFTERTKGAISDREMAMFSGATPGIDMSDDAAETVMQGMEAGAKRTVERSKFFESWMTEHRSLSGAQDAWDRFIKEKPVLEPVGQGKFKVNEKNVDAWKPYVGKSDRSQARSGQRQGAVGGGDALERARAAIAKGAPRDAVIRRLQDNGIDASGL